MSEALLTVEIRQEPDVVLVRQRARQIARLLGFESQDQVRIATAVSEVARNVYQYAGKGRIEFLLEGRTAPQVLLIRASDKGPGIADLPLLLSGRYRSPTGMGVGILGARRLMDQFDIESAPGAGTTVRLRKLLPASIPVLDKPQVAEIGAALAREHVQNPFVEVQHQNQELLRTLDELRGKQDELMRVNRELEDTNRGVVALYAELDEKAEHLRRADEMKSRFLSNMSHEFRTPLNSILALSRLLEERTDGDLSVEQEKQVGFIKKAAQDLSELVNDLLDLAKVEAGKTEIRPIHFEVRDLFGALRGMLRPLLVAESVHLIFEEPAADLPTLYTDEGKVSQVLRNFLSNALKFTEQGEIRVSALLADGGENVVFSVADTGIGIAPEDQNRIFREFGQIEGRLQAKVRGTGLGLALSKKLAELLGGTISLASAPGVGSTFSLIVPRRYDPPGSAEAGSSEPAAELPPLEPGRIPVLVVEDTLEDLHVYERLLHGTTFQIVPARSTREAAALLRTVVPGAILLDVELRGEQTWKFLAGLKEDEETRHIPVVVITVVDDPAKAAGLGADAYGNKPVDREWLLAVLRSFTERKSRALIIDDQAASRYVLKEWLGKIPLEAMEADHGQEGLRQARQERPQVIFLDLAMPGLDGFEVLDQLKADPATRAIPVIVATSQILEPEEAERLARWAVPVLSKETWAQPDALSRLQEALASAGWTPEDGSISMSSRSATP
ncbi:MAG TPA: ATP-binding protein [Thermoanaerobaculia bacterium]|nr:ATP-binding protein [Thermoanaerobaculia bacterium]